MTKRRYRPGDVVRCTRRTSAFHDRAGLVMAVSRGEHAGVRLTCDILLVAYGADLVETDVDSLALVRPVDPQLPLPIGAAQEG